LMGGCGGLEHRRREECRAGEQGRVESARSELWIACIVFTSSPKLMRRAGVRAATGRRGSRAYSPPPGVSFDHPEERSVEPFRGPPCAASREVLQGQRIRLAGERSPRPAASTSMAVPAVSDTQHPAEEGKPFDRGLGRGDAVCCNHEGLDQLPGRFFRSGSRSKLISSKIALASVVSRLSARAVPQFHEPLCDTVLEARLSLEASGFSTRGGATLVRHPATRRRSGRRVVRGCARRAP